MKTKLIHIISCVTVSYSILALCSCMHHQPQSENTKGETHSIDNYLSQEEKSKRRQKKDSLLKIAATNWDSLRTSFITHLPTFHLEKAQYAYPEYYGGSYIHHPNGFRLTVLVVKRNWKQDSLRIKKGLAERIKSQEFDIKPCTYSYKELKNMGDTLIARIKALPPSLLDSIQYTTFSLMEEENRIEVRIKKCNQQKISLFKRHVADSPILIFEDANKDDRAQKDF